MRRIISLVLVATALAAGADHRGVIRFNGLPLPGASVTVAQNGEKRYTVTDAEGRYAIEGVEAGTYFVEVEKQLF